MGDYHYFPNLTDDSTAEEIRRELEFVESLQHFAQIQGVPAASEMAHFENLKHQLRDRLSSAGGATAGSRMSPSFTHDYGWADGSDIGGAHAYPNVTDTYPSCTPITRKHQRAGGGSTDFSTKRVASSSSHQNSPAMFEANNAGASPAFDFFDAYSDGSVGDASSPAFLSQLEGPFEEVRSGAGGGGGFGQDARSRDGAFSVARELTTPAALPPAHMTQSHLPPELFNTTTLYPTPTPPPPPPHDTTSLEPLTMDLTDDWLNPFAAPPRLAHPQSGIIDLTGDGDQDTAMTSPSRLHGTAFPIRSSRPSENGHSIEFADPFKALDEAYKPQQYDHPPMYGQYPHPLSSTADGTTEWIWMDDSELSQFISTPNLVLDSNWNPPVNVPVPPRPTNIATPNRFDTMPQPLHHWTTPHATMAPGLANNSFPAPFDPDLKPVEEGAATEAISKLLQNIRPDEDTRRAQTPSKMKSQLMEHQKIGLHWFMRMERSVNKGGILADDMGLGKTVQAIALMLVRPSEDPVRKTTLIVAPVALMEQWVKEIELHVRPEHRLKVFTYHHSKATWDKLRQYDVVLTTFSTLGLEYKKKEKHAPDETLPLTGRNSLWYRVILDEAQNIKNRKALCSVAAEELKSIYRHCLTGTPMMNSIDELYPLLRFLRISPYNDFHKWSSDIGTPIKHAVNHSNLANDSQIMQRVHALLKSIMLRRTKDDQLDGRPIVVLPPKSTHREEVTLSEDERDLYQALETGARIKFNKYLKAGTVNNNYANILVLLLRLRQACCHPHLIKDLGVQVSTDGIAEDDLLDRARELGTDMAVVNRLKEIDGFECPICFDGTPNPTIFIPCGHGTCGECFQKLVDPRNENGDDRAAKCPECRGELSTARITDLAHFRKIFCPDEFPGADDESNDVVDADDSESDSDEEEDDDSNDSLDGFIVPDDDAKDEDIDEESEAGTERPEPEKQDKKRSKGKGKAKVKEPNAKKEKKTLAQLKKESMRNQAAKRQYLRRLRKQWETSAKLEKTMETLQKIYENDPTEKTLIFSQFTSLLDLLEVPMQDQGISYQRYDGSMLAKDRAAAVTDFMGNPNTRVMLVSLKAGNAGLNLNKASQVIILDPFWNPFVEDQAVDRAHRMRQEREVHVHRMLAPDTIEDRICTLQDKKRNLISNALDPNASHRIARLGLAELRYLFNGTGRDQL